mgnify:CR=1 FL=1
MTRDLHPEDYAYDVVWDGRGELLPARESKRMYESDSVTHFPKSTLPQFPPTSFIEAVEVADEGMVEMETDNDVVDVGTAEGEDHVRDIPRLRSRKAQGTGHSRLAFSRERSEFLERL